MANILDSIKQFIFYLDNHSFLRYLLVAAILIILLSMFLIRYTKSRKTSTLDELDMDMSAIAGEDMIATELDLAKAYIEMKQSEIAKKMLKNVLKKGNSSQKQQALNLIDTL